MRVLLSSSENVLYFSSPGTPSDTDQGGEERKDIEIVPRYEKGDQDISSGNEKALFSTGTPVTQTKEKERVTPKKGSQVMKKVTKTN
jgi:hypothetical protein